MNINPFHFPVSQGSRSVFDNKGKTKETLDNQKDNICLASPDEAEDGGVDEFDGDRDSNAVNASETRSAAYFGSKPRKFDGDSGDNVVKAPKTLDAGMPQKRKEEMILKLRNLAFKPPTEKVYLINPYLENTMAQTPIKRVTDTMRFSNVRAFEGKSDIAGENLPFEKSPITKKIAMSHALSQEKSPVHPEWINTEQGLKKIHDFKQRFMKVLAKNERHKLVKCKATLEFLKEDMELSFKVFNLDTLDVNTHKARKTQLIMESDNLGHGQQQNELRPFKNIKCVEIPTTAVTRKEGSAAKGILSTEGKKIVFAMSNFAANYVEGAKTVVARHPGVFHQKNRHLAYQIDTFKTALSKGIRVGFSPKVPGKNLYEFDMNAANHNDVRVANRMMLRSALKLVNVLEEMHADGVVYRDPKSPNIMFDPAYNPKYIQKLNGKTLFVINDKVFDLDSPDSLHLLIKYSNVAGIPLEEIFSLEDQLACFVDFDTAADIKRSDSLAHMVGTPLYKPYSVAIKESRARHDDVSNLLQCAKESDNFGIGKICLELTAQNNVEIDEISSFFTFKGVGQALCVTAKGNTFEGMAKYLRRFIREEYLNEAHLFFRDTSKFHEKYPDLTLAKMIKPDSEVPFL